MVTQLRTEEGVEHGLFGFFTAAPLSDLLREDLPGCTVTEDGACLAIRCADASAYVSPGAGTVVATVDGVEAISATPNAVGYGAGDDGQIFNVGNTIRITAAGDVLPGFTATVTAPEEPAVSLPSTITRSTDLTVSWDPTVAAEDVRVAISPGDPASTEIACRLDAAAGTVTIRRSLLEELSPGTATVSIAVYNSTTIRVGDYDIMLGATQEATASATIGD